jgi:hypothetical protein
MEPLRHGAVRFRHLGDLREQCPRPSSRRASAYTSWTRSLIAAGSSAVNPVDLVPVRLAGFCAPLRAGFLSAIPYVQALQQRVDPREAALRTLLDAVLHRRVALLGRGKAHGLRQLRPLTEILELERL